MKKVKDHYYHKAKKDGNVARSFYKLEEIDKKHRLLKKGQRVLDMGCFPGSWLQYVTQRIGNQGSAVGVDLQKMEHAMPGNVQCLHMDVFDLLGHPVFEKPFDVVLSDMAPKTTGIRSADAQRSHDLCLQVLEVARQHLVPGGSLVMKAFQGASLPKLRQETQASFQKVALCKPKSSRPESVEIFLLGIGKKDTPVSK